MGDAFSKDGEVTTFFENVPIAGYVTSAIHAAAGNEEHSKRAAAKCTASTVTTAGTVAGGLVAGPAGAMAAGALAGTAGNAAGADVASHIDDDRVRASAPNHSATNYVCGGAFGAVSGGLGGTVGALATSTAAKVTTGQAAAVFGAQLPKTILQKGK